MYRVARDTHFTPPLLKIELGGKSLAVKLPNLERSGRQRQFVKIDGAGDMDFAYRIGAVTETVCATRREAVDGGGGEVAVLQSLLSKVERELVGTVVSLHGLKTEKYNGFVGTILGLANEAGEPRLKVE